MPAWATEGMCRSQKANPGRRVRETERGEHRQTDRLGKPAGVNMVALALEGFLPPAPLNPERSPRSIGWHPKTPPTSLPRVPKPGPPAQSLCPLSAPARPCPLAGREGQADTPGQGPRPLKRARHGRSGQGPAQSGVPRVRALREPSVRARPGQGPAEAPLPSYLSGLFSGPAAAQLQEPMSVQGGGPAPLPGVGGPRIPGRGPGQLF